jgi:hypothetical protein
VSLFCLNTKYYLTDSNDLLFIAVKQKDIDNFRTDAMMLFYILQKKLA